MTDLTYTTPSGTVIDAATPAGVAALRVEIAKRRGWRIFRTKDGWRFLVSPTETLYNLGNIHKTDDEAWREAHESRSAGHYPNWPTDANAALTLWHELPRDIRVGLIDDLNPLAIALAWLAFSDAQQAATGAGR